MCVRLTWRIAFTIGALLVCVVGSDIPIPGLHPAALKALFWGPEPSGLDMWIW